MKQKPYTILFVCRGNTYRSRLAAAYMATLVSDDYSVVSAGISANKSRAKHIERYTKYIANQYGLSHGIEKTDKTQLTQAMLDNADIIIFLKKDVYDEARQSHLVDARKTLVWQIADISDSMRNEYDNYNQKLEIVLPTAVRTFVHIQKQCNELLKYVSAGSWVDVYTESNQPTGLRLPISWVCDRGFWHRGVHVVVQTHDGSFVVCKRAKQMVFSPDMLEISLGGIIDTGEQPLHAAIRETSEEIGIHIPSNHFKPLFIRRSVSYHQSSKKHSKVFIYVYQATLLEHSEHMKPQKNEVSDIRVLTGSQTKRLLRLKRAKNFGRLKYGYTLYSRAVRESLKD